MALKYFKPDTPAKRGLILVDRKELWKGKPHKFLTEKLKTAAGRNADGHITCRHQGSGVKKMYRRIDFKRLREDAVAVVLKGMNRAYKVTETRNFIYTRALSLLMVFVDTMVMFLSINLIVFGKAIINLMVTHFHMSAAVAITLLTLRWPVAFAALYLMAFLSYYILPDLRGNDRFKRKSAIPGTWFFVTFWLIGSWGFSIYVNNLKTYNMVYGTIGAFAVLMVWLYYTSVLVLIGAEINSQVYNQLERKAQEIRDDFAKLSVIEKIVNKVVKKTEDKSEDKNEYKTD